MRRILRDLLICCTTFVLAIQTTDTAAQRYHFKPIDNRFDSVASKLSRLDYDNKREQITDNQLSLLDDIAAKSDDKQLKARAIYWRTRAKFMDTAPADCVKLLEKALSMCQPGHEYDKACISYQLAGNYERLGMYLKTYELLSDAIPVFNECGDHFFHGNASLLMAQLFLDISDPESASKHLAEAEKEYKMAKFPLNRIYFFKAELSEGTDKIKFLKMSVREGGERDWGMTIQAYNNITEIFLDRNALDSAAYYSAKSHDIMEGRVPDDSFFWTLYNINRAKVMFAHGSYGNVIRTLRHEEHNKTASKEERLMMNVYEYLWKAYEKTAMRDSAYHYLQLYTSALNTNYLEMRRHDVQKAQARESIARHNDKIKILEQDVELNKRYMALVILLAVVVLLVGLALFIYFYQRYRIKKAENRELQNSLRQEHLIHSMNRKNFERDMKQKDCEISSSTLLLANKNEVLQQISSITKKFSEEGKIPKEYVTQINGVIGDSLKNDDEWQRFKLHFDSVHPDFFVKLKAASNELTENDLRLCAYISIGMRAKQIAEMLSVSPDSVNSNRYRLRKKLGLGKGESLDDFIRKM